MIRVRSDDSSDVHNKSGRKYDADDAVYTLIQGTAVRKQGDLGSKARKERATRNVRAQTKGPSWQFCTREHEWMSPLLVNSLFWAQEP